MPEKTAERRVEGRAWEERWLSDVNDDGDDMLLSLSLSSAKI